jgi:hypothetical protein
MKLVYFLFVLSLLPTLSYGSDCNEWTSKLAGGGINAPDRDGYTALHRATLRNEIDLVEILLSKGADPLIQNQFHRTALQIAAENGNLQILKLLFNNTGFNPNSEITSKVFLAAVSRSQSEVLDYLKEKGVQVSKVKGDPFAYALQFNQFELAFWLLEHGASLQLPSKKTFYPALTKHIDRVAYYFLTKAYQQQLKGKALKLPGIDIVLEFLVEKFKSEPSKTDHLYPLIKVFQSLKIKSVWIHPNVIKKAELQHIEALAKIGLKGRFEDNQKIIHYGRLLGLLNQDENTPDLLELQFRRQGSLESQGFRRGKIISANPKIRIPDDLSMAWLYLDPNHTPPMKNTHWRKLGMSYGPNRIYYIHDLTKEVVSISLTKSLYTQGQLSAPDEATYLQRIINGSFDDSNEGRAHAKILNGI